MHKQWLIGCALTAALLALPGVAGAYEAADSDAVYLGVASSNIEIRDSDDLVEGGALFGGVRIGLFWTTFVELGYGAISFTDTFQSGTQTKRLTFRTTGAHYGLGLLLPIRGVALGTRAHVNPGNQWAEKIEDDKTGVVDSRTSGEIDFNSYYVFVRIGRWVEVGVRRDDIVSTDSVVENSFGPYFSLLIPLGPGGERGWGMMRGNR